MQPLSKTSNKVDPLAQSVEHNNFNVGVLGSSPKRITQREAFRLFFVLLLVGLHLAGCIADEVGGVYMLTDRTDTLQAVADQQANIEFNASGEWTARTTDTWLEVAPQSGPKGRNIIQVRSTQANRTRQLRKGEVIVSSDGKSKAVEVVQRDDYALFGANQYLVGPEGGEVNISFSTNVESGHLYISYVKYNWYSIGDSSSATRSDSWDGKIKPIMVSPNENPEPRSARFVLGIYDKRKVFLPLDSTWIHQGGIE